MSRSKKDGKHGGGHHRSKCIMCRNPPVDTKGRHPCKYCGGSRRVDTEIGIIACPMCPDAKSRPTPTPEDDHE